ncbi:hypothetical protein P692DRAFT_20233922 [Suillus brevipes Sb2]|nr:hypothetical protein P692DRAFT_20233922 [Suillus brevipes Sb2]
MTCVLLEFDDRLFSSWPLRLVLPQLLIESPDLESPDLESPVVASNTRARLSARRDDLSPNESLDVDTWKTHYTFVSSSCVNGAITITPSPGKKLADSSFDARTELGSFSAIVHKTQVLLCLPLAGLCMHLCPIQASKFRVRLDW